MHRDPNSHKGENGKVAVIGGSRYIHGAPILSVLAAEASGVDLLTLILPVCHTEVAKSTCLNCFVHPFAGNDIQNMDRALLLELLATIDVALIGPGIAHEESQISVLMNLIAQASCPMVLDASALQPKTLEGIRGKTAVLTPHLGELERMNIAFANISRVAKDVEVTICVKGKVDTIASPDGNIQEVSGGNAGLTVGGTGDVLAGLITGLMAQRIQPTKAALQAANVLKSAGESLYEQQGFAYTARDIIDILPAFLR